MAQMFPKRISPHTQSKAEQRLYQAFKEQLPDSFLVFHSVHWLSRTSRDGEADFIIVHPSYGALVLEVKGGAIRYDGELGQWFSNDIPIKDPVLQAQENKFRFLEKLKGLPSWNVPWITLGHAVAFPDVQVDHDLLPALPKELVLDALAIQDLYKWVCQAFAYWQSQDSLKELPSTALETIRHLLSPSWELRPLLKNILKREEEEIFRLTEEQFSLLDFLQGQRRALIVGCAGSGKTMLALERARRLASEGFQVLLTCFNRSLAERLREQVQIPGVEIQNFHRLVPAWVQEAKLQEELAHRAAQVDEDFLFAEVFPEFLVKAVDIIGPRYDALIVDEGQDFSEVWLLALSTLLKDPDRGIIYIFKDDNQNLFQPTFELPWEMPSYFLSRNCRNTRQIHRAVIRFYRSSTLPRAIGPEGRPPEVRFYSNPQELKHHLRNSLHRLLQEEKLSNTDLVVLSAHKRGIIQPGQRFGNYTLTEKWPPAPNEIFWSSVQSFKGLESPIVILVELDATAYPNPETVAYVGMSRARNHLIVLADQALPAPIHKNLIEKSG